MWKTFFAFSSLCGCILLSSCASERTVTYSKAEARGIRKFETDVEFKVGDEGQAEWKNAKRSSFESQAGFAGSKQFKGKSYDKNGYQAKQWSQNKQFAASEYTGNKDGSKYQRSPYFASKQAAAQGQSANLGAEDYKAGSYNDAAKKAGVGRSFDKPEDAATNHRRRVYAEPEIQSSQEYNGISLSESNSLLGR